MKESSITEELQTLVVRSRLKQAIQLLIGKASDEELKSAAIQLQQRLTSLKRKEMMGTMGFADISIEQNKITTAILGLGTEIENQLKNPPPAPPYSTPTTLATSPTPTPKGNIYFSYAWGTNEATGVNREELVNQLYDSLVEDGFSVKRDKMDLSYGESITSFEQQIGKAALIIVCISDKYLRSTDCMFELYEIMRNSRLEPNAFRNRILPVFVEEYIDLKVSRRNQALDQYRNYWVEELKYLEGKQAEWGTDFSELQQRELRKVADIKQNFGKMTGTIADINASSKNILSENSFQIIKQTIIFRLNKNE